MKKNKFLKVFGALEKKEQKEFLHFVEGLYANQTIALSLLNYTIKNHATTNEQRLEKDFVLKKIFKISTPTPPNRKNLDNTFSKLLGYLNEFLLWKKNKKKTLASDFQLLDILKERRLDDLYFSKIEELIKQLNKEKNPTIWERLSLMQLHHHTFYHTNFSKIKSPHSVLNEGMQHLDDFFGWTKLKMAAEMLNRQNILQEQYEIHFLDEVLDYFSKTNSNIFVSLIHFLKNKTIKDYENLEQIFSQTIDTLHADEQLIIISILLNYHSSEMKKGNIDAYQKAFTLFQFGLENKIFSKEDGYISSTKFNNIVLVGCRLKEYDWVENFIKENQKLLVSKNKTNTVKMANAYLLFEKKNYHGVIKMLRSVEFQDDFFSLRIKSILLRSYYELNATTNRELILSHAKAFFNYLKRNKNINSKTIDSYLSMIKFVRMLLHKNVDAAKIQQELEKTEQIFFKSWIIEKVQLLADAQKKARAIS